MTKNKINVEAFDELLKDCKDPAEVEAVFKQPKYALRVKDPRLRIPVRAGH